MAPNFQPFPAIPYRALSMRSLGAPSSRRTQMQEQGSIPSSRPRSSNSPAVNERPGYPIKPSSTS